MKTIFILLLVAGGSTICQAQLYVSPTANLHLSGDAQITLQNTDLITDGTISAPATGRFIFNGSANNNISGTTAPTFAELEIAKTGTGQLDLQTDINVTDKMVFTTNLVELNNHNINLGSTGFLENENENSRITGTGGGTVFCNATLNAPTAANPANLGAVITTTQNLGNTVITRGHQSQTNGGGGGSSTHRYFDILPTNNSTLNATLRINYFDAEKNMLDENNFEIYKSTDHVNWTNIGQSLRNSSTNFVEQQTINSFARFTLSTSDVVLPVNGLQLSGIWNNNAAHLNWVTLTEHNNRKFNIERKYDNEFNFTIIGSKNSAHANGNSNLPTHYRWIDYANDARGPIQYRVQQQDLDGHFAYSNIIVLKPEVSLAFIKNIYPTLVSQNQLYIKIGNKNVQKMQLSIYDMKGSRVFYKELSYQSQQLSLPELNAGTYNIIIRSGANHWSANFVKD